MIKPISLLTCFLFAFSFCYAQDVVIEVGLTFSSLDNFGLTYKRGTNSALWRFDGAYLSGGSSKHEGKGDASTIEQSSYGFHVGAGREFRKPIADDLQLRYGIGLALGYDYSNLEENTVNTQYQIQSSTYTTTLKAIIGLNYVFKEKIVFGAEVLPGIYYQGGKTRNKQWNNDFTTERNISGFGASFSSSSAMLTLAYRI